MDSLETRSRLYERTRGSCLGLAGFLDYLDAPGLLAEHEYVACYSVL